MMTLYAYRKSLDTDAAEALAAIRYYRNEQIVAAAAIKHFEAEDNRRAVSAWTKYHNKCGLRQAQWAEQYNAINQQRIAMRNTTPAQFRAAQVAWLSSQNQPQQLAFAL